MATQLLTPRMAELLARIRRAGRPPFESMSAAQARAAYAQAAEILDLPRAPLHEVRDLSIPIDGRRRRPARLYRAEAEARGTLLYLHGGGFTIGGLQTHDSLCRQLALRSGAGVLAFDYRLAPGGVTHDFIMMGRALDEAGSALAFAGAALRRAFEP
jgi:acetyl esterase